MKLMPLPIVVGRCGFFATCALAAFTIGASADFVYQVAVPAPQDPLILAENIQTLLSLGAEDLSTEPSEDQGFTVAMIFDSLRDARLACALMGVPLAGFRLEGVEVDRYITPVEIDDPQQKPATPDEALGLLTPFLPVMGKYLAEGEADSVQPVREHYSQFPETPGLTHEMVIGVYEDHMPGLTDAASSVPPNAEALFYLAHYAYIRALVLTEQRVLHRPLSRGEWPEDSLYRASLALFESSLSSGVEGIRKEEAEYHLAALQYALSKQRDEVAHHRLRLARSAYRRFVDECPNSPSASRAYMSVVGCCVELARLGCESYEQVVEDIQDFLAEPFPVSDYAGSRVRLMLAETLAWRLGEREAGMVVAREVVNDYRSEESRRARSEAYLLLTYAALALGKHEQAAQYAETLLREFDRPEDFLRSDVNGKRAKASLGLARAYVGLGKTDDAVALLKQMKGQSPAENTMREIAELEKSLIVE